MNPLMRFMIKVAARKRLEFEAANSRRARPIKSFEAPKVPGPRIESQIKKQLKQLGPGHVTKRELRRIEKTIKKVKPKTEKEKKVEQVAGRKWTKGQYKRYAAIGAGAGMATRIAARGIEGAGPWFRAVKGKAGEGALKPVFSPRGMAAAGAIGAIYGAAMPAAKRLIDIEAAKRGKF